MNMRAKMRIININSFPEYGSENLTFAGVAKNGAYPPDGSDEDNTFARFTPNLNLQMTIANPKLVGQYEIGDTFYVDFKLIED